MSTPDEDAAFAVQSKKAWEGSPYPPIFVTVDAVVVHLGKVLLVRRAGMPGRGRLALPGGYIDECEPLVDGAVRELVEETRISTASGVISAKTLRGWIAGNQVFDAPFRSILGRVITHAFLFRVPSELVLSVSGGDDAASAEWHDLANLNPLEFFEDHFAIIRKMT